MSRIFLAVALILACTACRKPAIRQLSWDVTLSGADTAPYGCKLAYELIKYHFPAATLSTLPSKFRYTSIDDEMRYAEGASLLVAVGLHFRLGDEELEDLLSFIRSGNEVVIFCSRLDAKLEKRMRADANGGGEEFPVNGDWNRGEMNLAVLSLDAQPQRTFGHFGRNLRGHFELDSFAKSKLKSDTEADIATYDQSEYDSGDDLIESSYDYDSDTTVVPEILGRAAGKPNILRRAFGEGHLTVHLAPLALSNYFLLQPGNLHYLDGVWSTLPSGINAVYWHGYFKRQAESSSMAILWRHPATRWALILSLLALGLYVLFESKRRQRIVPIRTLPQNTSVAFVETVGRLYYARSDHANLATKMVQHFLEGVRNAYGMQTTELNEAFADSLSRKSGCSAREAAAATFVSREVRTGNFAVSEEYIHHLYRTLLPFQATTNA